MSGADWDLGSLILTRHRRRHLLQVCPTMTLTGLTVNPSRCLLTPVRLPGKPSRLVSAFVNTIESNEKIKLLCLKGGCTVNSATRYSPRRPLLIKCSRDASFGEMANEPSSGSAIFPRINVRDPYKRLGISKEASEDEIQSARNFLIHRYSGHKPSVDAIESAHDKIIMQQLYDRRRPKIDVKKRFREVNQSRVMQFIRSRFQSPSTKVLIKTAIVFLVLGVLTILFPTEEGPTLQVALSLVATIYILYNRLKSKARAFLYGAGSFAVSWLVGAFLMVSVIPPILKGLRGFEVTTSLVTYILLWVSSSYLK